MKKNTKGIAAILLSTALTLSLAGCSSSEKPPAEAKKEPETTLEGGTSGYTGGSYKISIGHVCSESHTIHQVCEAFKSEVEEKSEGAITVEIHPNSELGGDEAMLESVALGTLTMVIPSATMLSTYVKEYDVLGMPYLFEDVNTAFEAVDGGLGDLLNQKLADADVGFINLGYNFNGIRNMTNNKRPIKTPDDLKGLKMRCMSNPIFIKMFETLGANATPMSWSELFTAMQQGTVDGEENPASLIYESKFHEVQKYISTTEHIYDFCGVIIGSSFYDSLDAQAKKIIDDAVRDQLVNKQRIMETEKNQEYLELLQAEGMELTELTPEERKVFSDKVAPMYEGWEENYGEDIVNAMEKYRK